MNNIRKIDSRIWNSARFMALSAREKLIFFQLQTDPSFDRVRQMSCADLEALIAALRFERGVSK